MTKLKQLVGHLLCRLGFHSWRSDSDNIDGHSGWTIAVVWWQCERCAKTKLKFISH